MKAKFEDGDTPNPVMQKYRYCGTPDGDDYFYKLAYFCKYSTYVGFCVGIYDVAGIQKFRDPVYCAHRLLKCTSFGFAVGVTYVSAYTCLGAIRKKDDAINHAIAGYIGGALFGYWHKKSSFAGPYWGLPWALVAYTTKWYITHRVDPIGADKDGVISSNYFHDLMNWDTLFEDRPKSWTTGYEEKPTVLPDRRGW